MQSIEKKDDRNEEDNKNVEEEGNERYGGREGGGWHGGLDTPLHPLMGVSTPDTVKKQSSANLWLFLQYDNMDDDKVRVREFCIKMCTFTQRFLVPSTPHLANAAVFLSSTKTFHIRTAPKLITTGLGVP